MRVTKGRKFLENICLSPMFNGLHFLSQRGYPVKKSHMSHMLRMSQGDGNCLEIFVCHQCFMGYTSLINDAIQLRNHTCHTCYVCHTWMGIFGNISLSLTFHELHFLNK